MAARCLRVEHGGDTKKTILAPEQELLVSLPPSPGRTVAWLAADAPSYWCEPWAAAWTCGEERWMVVQDIAHIFRRV